MLLNCKFQQRCLHIDGFGSGRALNSPGGIELFSLTACTLVQTRQTVVAWANLEAPSSRDRYRAGTKSTFGIYLK